jgi:hypothetical protein
MTALFATHCPKKILNWRHRWKMGVKLTIDKLEKSMDSLTEKYKL